LSITLGMMARAPVPGRCKTRLAATLGEMAAARLYEAMLVDSMESYTRVGATRNVVVAAPEFEGVRILSKLAPRGWEVIPQEGTGLGERLTNAFRALKVDGSPVLLMDSDSPTLPIEPVSAAVQRFNGVSRVLLGPTDDGGYYLIGLSSLDLDVFRDIPWSTPRVLEATLARCAALSLSTELLPSWYDVDERKDLERLATELSSLPAQAPRCAGVLRDLGLWRGAR